ncbi:M3 family oligoendopeptidase [Alicyclobacillus sp. ALC3]|uniref:M3 family oligoendopeptidase n=1 Tax=Alicyclobacillus sp. ALC3 TaxID=2796143 RepID=UPI002378F935|nr:M3 family oligoendopeptidase [Alicyclobacillus sp. ALC3]WDL97518.1 M3 family oligoendopeptidase [Alicyclobacillus sp. ALC3]
MSEQSPTKFYVEFIDLKEVPVLETHYHDLLEREIGSVEALEAWLQSEQELHNAILEAMLGHQIEFVCDTADAQKRDTYMHDQTVVQPVMLKFEAELDKKFCNSPFMEQLDERRYGLIRRQRLAKVQLFRAENIPLTVREQELVAKYNELMGGLTVEWEGESQPYPFMMPLLDAPDRGIRERAWRAGADARERMKSQMDEILNELVSLRHQMATNAGFENYRDYMFEAKSREYTVEDCYAYHRATETYLVPALNRLNEALQRELGLDTFRPWDVNAKQLQGAPFSTAGELMDGVYEMLQQTDQAFADRFQHMRENGLLDLEVRPGKGPGGFCAPLPLSRDAFIFANFSPSFFAVIALLHEMGHALNFYAQLENDGFRDENFRSEIAELYSHSMELLLSDKLQRFYPEERSFRVARREVLRRGMTMLTGPLAGDVFQHWLYTHPNHTVEERDRKYTEVMKRFMLNSVDISDVESGIASNWFSEPHILAYPFYNIEYSMSELGALQLFEIYRTDPNRAIDLYKQGEAASYERPIAEVYQVTGVEFDFTEPVIRRVALFLEQVIGEFH